MEGYMSVSEAAEALGVTRGRVNKLIHAGRLDAERIGGRFIVKTDSVLARLENPPKAGNPNFGNGYNRWKTD